MLPVLAILLTGIGFVRTQYQTKARVILEARRCAWQFALRGCQGDAPPGCEAPAVTRSKELADQGQRIRSASSEAVTGGEQVFEDAPMLGDALSGLLGEKTSTRRERSVRPPWDPRQARLVEGSVSLLCNERPRDVLGVAKRILGNKLQAL